MRVEAGSRDEKVRGKKRLEGCGIVADRDCTHIQGGVGRKLFRSKIFCGVSLFLVKVCIF